MFTNRNDERTAEQALHWSARVLSLVSTVVLVLFFVGERFEISHVAAKEWVGLFLFPLGVIVGFAVAWWNDGIGGAITTASLLAFYLFYGLLLRGNINQGWAFIVFASPGLLFLLSWLRSRSTRPAAMHT
jgi:hypothetical protein